MRAWVTILIDAWTLTHMFDSSRYSDEAQLSMMMLAMKESKIEGFTTGTMAAELQSRNIKCLADLATPEHSTYFNNRFGLIRKGAVPASRVGNRTDSPSYASVAQTSHTRGQPRGGGQSRPPRAPARPGSSAWKGARNKPPSERNMKRSTSLLDRMPCFACGKYGHIAKDCDEEE